MLDDLRSSTSFQEDEEQSQMLEEEQGSTRRSSRRGREPFLGMTAPQRFVLSLMLFFMTCVLGILALIILEKIYIPIF